MARSCTTATTAGRFYSTAVFGFWGPTCVTYYRPGRFGPLFGHKLRAGRFILATHYTARRIIFRYKFTTVYLYPLHVWSLYSPTGTGDENWFSAVLVISRYPGFAFGEIKEAAPTNQKRHAIPDTTPLHDQ
eukprot:1122383-Prymnesium_polylepis.1